MTYHILPFRLGESILALPQSDSEIIRAHRLAKSLRGRWAPGISSYYIRSSSALKWALLFGAGWTFENGQWRCGRFKTRRLSRAMALAKRERVAA